MKTRLTDTSVSSLKAGIYWDLLLPAFGLHVGKRRRTFLVNKAGTRKAIGHYPKVSLADARRKAALILDGHAKTEAVNVKTALDEYLTAILVSPRTRRDYTRLLNRHLAQNFTRPIASITLDDTLTITSKLSKTPSEARHAYDAMKVFFNWSIDRRYIQVSPVFRHPPALHQKRSHVLSPDELHKVWVASDTQGNFGLVVKLCILTGARRSEVPGPKTFTHNTVTFLNTKNGNDHTLPLTPLTKSLFAQLQPCKSWSRPKHLLDEASGVTGYVLHDLRRSFATHCAALGVAPAVIERCLNHAAPSSLGGSLGVTYNKHSYMAEMAEALDKHEKWVLALIARAN